ncbi:MAG: precorrin-2 C(20)-methyltransferase [Spongiibacteraceae bacterium]|nr:precorrin-2 C(20)-methyltransferase [Spongiibacteraceae bacterium]
MNDVCFYGVGVGPGDPELITLKALRAIQQADAVIYLTNNEGVSYARNVVSDHLADTQSGQIEYPIIIPMNLDRREANKAYDAAAQVISTCLDTGKSVVFLCEGDPLFFASFAYLLERLGDKYPCKTIPGICSINAASAAIQSPLVMLSESLAVISARHSDKKILNTLEHYDSVVILKVGAARERLLNLINKSGRAGDAQYLEYISGKKQKIVKNIFDLSPESGPYFSLFLLTRAQRNTQ